MVAVSRHELRNLAPWDEGKGDDPKCYPVNFLYSSLRLMEQVDVAHTPHLASMQPFSEVGFLFMRSGILLYLHLPTFPQTLVTQ